MSVSGNVSGLGSSQITAELTQIEDRLAAPIAQLQEQVKTDTADISAWGAIKGGISSLSSALTSLKDPTPTRTTSAAPAYLPLPPQLRADRDVNVDVKVSGLGAGNLFQPEGDGLRLRQREYRFG